MKKLTLIFVAILFAVTGISAQTPNQFKYQAVLRDASGNVMANETVTVDISILKGSANGTSVFTEQHTVTTTAQGLINLNIGSVSDLSAVDFSNDIYFAEISVNGTVMGTSQLLSVPYALQAKNVENDQVDDADADPSNELQDLTLNGTMLEISGGTGADLSSLQDGVGDGSETKVTAGTNVSVTGTGTTADPYVINAADQSPAHYIGELYGGGIIFWLDNTGEHGLIASLDDLDGGSGAAWSATNDILIGASAQSFYDGASNTAAIVAQDNTAGYAATLCNSYTGGGFTDWYLPAQQELRYLESSSLIINQVLANDGNAATNGLNLSNSSPYGYYWSSTEYSRYYTWTLRLRYSDMYRFDKSSTYRVRAVRAF